MSIESDFKVKVESKDYSLTHYFTTIRNNKRVSFIFKEVDFSSSSTYMHNIISSSRMPS